MTWLLDKARGAWEALLVAAVVVIGFIAFFTWRVPKPSKRKPEPNPHPTDGRSAADVAADILDAERKRDADAIRADLASDNPHERIAARWRGRS